MGDAMTDIDLDELEALAEAATPGLWVTRFPSHTVVMAATPDGTYQGEVARTVSGSLNAHRGANAAFIAAANPATIKTLIASAREAADGIERLRGLLKPFAVYYEINDLDERLADDAIEVPVGDLRAVYRAIGARGGVNG